MRRYRWWFGSLVLLFVASLLGVFVFTGAHDEAGLALPQPGPPGTGPLTIAALGDSTVAGEGAGDYDPATAGQNGDWCHRSPNAAVLHTTVPGIEARLNLACSGAPAAQVGLGTVTQWTEPSQAGQLAQLVKNHRVSVVVVGVGANDDPAFANSITGCFKAWLNPKSQACRETLRPQWQGRIDNMVPKVVAALADVRRVLADAGYQQQDYQLVLQSYAAPIGPGIPEDLRSLNGCPFRTEDLQWVNGEAVQVLSTGLRQAATQAGARYLDLSRAGLGHEACSGGADKSKEWFTRLTLQLADLGKLDRASHALQESFHPNAAGHAQFARCLTEFLGTGSPSSSCVAGADGNLHPAATVIAR